MWVRTAREGVKGSSWEHTSILPLKRLSKQQFDIVLCLQALDILPVDGRELGKDSLQNVNEERAVCAQQSASLEILLIYIKVITIWQACCSTGPVVLFSCALKICSILIMKCSFALIGPICADKGVALCIWFMQQNCNPLVLCHL